MDMQKENPVTDTSSNEIIKRQIAILEQLNQKLLLEIDSAGPVIFEAYAQIEANIRTIFRLVNSLDQSF